MPCYSTLEGLGLGPRERFNSENWRRVDYRMKTIKPSHSGGKGMSLERIRKFVDRLKIWAISSENDVTSLLRITAIVHFYSSKIRDYIPESYWVNIDSRLGRHLNRSETMEALAVLYLHFKAHLNSDPYVDVRDIVTLIEEFKDMDEEDIAGIFEAAFPKPQRVVVNKLKNLKRSA